MQTIHLTGDMLTAADLAAVSTGARIALDAEGLGRMQAARAVFEAELAKGQPIYGATRGLGPRVVQTVEDADRFSLAVIHGRAHAVGPALPHGWVAAALAVRANTLLRGATSARPRLAAHLVDCLRHDLVPMVRKSGSIGAADLIWGGQMALGLIGQGKVLRRNGMVAEAEAAFAEAGVTPFQPLAGEGLVMVSHGSFSAANAALGVHQAAIVLEAAQTSAAMSLEAFRANLSPLDPAQLAHRPMAGQDKAADALRALLAGSSLWEEGTARRLQDPLSLRNIVQIHGAVLAALDTATIAAEQEINGASDNPGVVARDGEIRSNGNFLNPYLEIVLTGLNHGMVHLAAASLARCSRLLSSRFTDLPNGLVNEDAAAAGLGAILKVAEALFAEIAHAAMPAPIYPSMSADGVEDVITHVAIPAEALHRICAAQARLTAIEAIIAAQALDLRRPDPMPDAIARAQAALRAVVARLEADRPLGEEVETLATLIEAGGLAGQ